MRVRLEFDRPKEEHVGVVLAQMSPAPEHSPRPPLISVIVCAFGRSAFLSNAIESVISQDFNHDLIEVVLETDLEHPELELRLKGRLDAAGIHFTVHKPGKVPLGKSLHDATLGATGSLLAFLNDDDEWESNRLTTVADAFRSNPMVGFFHNSQHLIDANSKPYPAPVRFALVRHPSLLFDFLSGPITAKDFLSETGLLFKLEPDFNSSSIAIRRRHVLAHVETIDKLRNLDDFFFLAAVLADGAAIYLCGERLTRYRVHSQNLSFASSRARADREDAMAALSERHLEAIEIIARGLGEDSESAIGSLLEAERCYLGLVNAVETRTIGRRELASRLRRASGLALGSPSFKFMVVYTAAAVRMVIGKWMPLLYRALT